MVKVRAIGTGIAWRRPGKDRGISATTGTRLDIGDNLFPFTTSTEFTAGEPIDKFGAYMLLNFGNRSAATVKAATAKLHSASGGGYGVSRKPPTPMSTPSTNGGPALNGAHRPAPAAAPKGLIEQAADQLDFATPEIQAPEVTGTGTRQIRVTRADTIEDAPVVWAWEEDGSKRIPAGSLVNCAGREGTGKSSFGIWLAAHITQGTLPGSFFGRPKRVLYAAMEDSWKYTLVPRLRAAGADLKMIYRIDVTTEENTVGTLSLPSDNAALERTIVENDVALIVIDALMSIMSGHIDTHKAHEVRSALDPLSALADRTAAIVVGIAHFNKGNGSDVATLIAGSGAFKDVPRAVFGFAKDDDGSRVMSQVKNSLGIDELPSLSYRIDQKIVQTANGPAETGLFVWVGESDRTVMDILRGDKGDDDDDSAGAWIKDYLRSRGGSAPAAEVYTAGEERGFTSDALKKARYRAKNPKIKSARTGFAGTWVWSIPSAPSQDP